MSEETAADAATAAPEAGPGVSKEDLDQAIARRQAALDRAREAEAKLADMQAQLEQRTLKEKEEQGKWQELATEHKSAADDLAGKLKAASERLKGLEDRHRGVLMQRFEALPEAARETISGDLGENPELDQLERSLKLAEAFSAQLTNNPSKPAARQVNGTPAASTGAVRQGAKMDAEALSRLTRDERAAYLRENYGSR